ncbi:hypothetical protein [Actinacidiphila sp. ITFR-21]|uniref:hypothetical protein n=1 Tax=Actinacidiphila sp. ITFR-21 TaxID=3075199 RepID=UPI00288A68C7|nr:hypothetical protein [Streptomyces sp. ITFR-21]WNI17652.1 hypothetical protein RLT57_20395 [Streptomyces sp. ITFR-21]WNI17792.1 hypothetical protein RLT57_21110 [Streptomyces sp. ITFR-21]
MPSDQDGGLTVYRERAYLLGGYVGMFGGVFAFNDRKTPNWPVLYIESPKGQLSWHIHPDDKDVFDGLNVPMVDGYAWDGHNTAEKYLRIEALNLLIPKMTYAKPEFGNP